MTEKHNPNRNNDGEKIFKKYQATTKYRKILYNMYLEGYKNHLFKKEFDDLYNRIVEVTKKESKDFSAYNLLRELNPINSSKASIPIQEMILSENQDFYDISHMELAMHNDKWQMLMMLAYLETYLMKSKDNQNSNNEVLTARYKEHYDALILVATFILLNEYNYFLELFMIAIDEANLQDLDENLLELTPRGLISRFLRAIDTHERDLAYKILGLAYRDLDPGEGEYLEAMAKYSDSEYDQAIKCCLKINEDDIDYYKSLSILCGCYAGKGDIDSLIKCINENKDSVFSFLQVFYYVQEALINYGKVDGITIINDRLNIEMIDLNEEVGNVYRKKIINNITDCLGKLIQACEEENYYGSVTNISDEVFDKQYIGYLSSLAWTKAHIDYPLLDEIVEDMHEEMTYDEFTNLKIKIIDLIKMLYGKNYYKDPDNCVFNLEYELKLEDLFIEDVNKHAYFLIKNYQKKENEQIRTILINAYYLEKSRGNINSNIEKFVIKKFSNLIDDNNIYIHELNKMLSKDAALALESAELQYALSKDIDWGWRDAGMISLGFYRVVECELNRKIIIPVINSFTIDELQELQERYGGNKAWNKNLQTMYMYACDNNNDLMLLGSLEVFFKNITPNKTNEISLLFIDKVKRLINNPNDYEDFIHLVRSKLVAADKRNEYRNPPAHTKYLPYNKAVECRDYVCENLFKFEEFFN